MEIYAAEVAGATSSEGFLVYKCSALLT